MYADNFVWAGDDVINSHLALGRIKVPLLTPRLGKEDVSQRKKKNDKSKIDAIQLH